MLGTWGTEAAGGTRVLASEAMWRKPLAWDKAAAKSGERHLVFTASLADVFEEWSGHVVDSQGRVMWEQRGKIVGAGRTTLGLVHDEQTASLDDVRLRLFALIRDTPALTWLILTKRPESVMDTLKRCRDGTPDLDLGSWLDSWVMGYPPSNVWLGVTAEDQKWADRRVPGLLKVPAVVRFVSYEPAIGPVDWTPWLPYRNECRYFDGVESLPTTDEVYPRVPRIGWLICGGESGAHARRFDLAWARSAIRQCKAAGVPAFVKQLGARATDEVNGIAGRSLDVHPDAAGLVSLRLRHPAGADPGEWPADLRVQEHPASSVPAEPAGR